MLLQRLGLDGGSVRVRALALLIVLLALVAASDPKHRAYRSRGGSGGSVSFAAAAVEEEEEASTDPYDLSGIEADLVAAFDDESSARPSWPTEPTIESGPNNATTCADLESGIVHGEHVRVASGTTIGSAGTPCGTINFAGDNRLEIQSGATVWASNFSISGAGDARVQIDGGGTLETNSASFVNSDDILIDGIYVSTFDDGIDSDNFVSSTVFVSRHAYVNNAIEADRYAFFYGQATGVDDLIVAGNDVLCSRTPTNDGEACIRTQVVDRYLNYRNRWQSVVDEKEAVRLYDDSDNALLIENVLETNPGGRKLTIESHSPSQQGNIANVNVVRNRFMTTETDSAGEEISYGVDDVANTCDLIVITANELWTANARTFSTDDYVPGTADCTNVTVSASVSGDIDLSPYFGTVPTCSTLGFCGMGVAVQATPPASPSSFVIGSITTTSMAPQWSTPGEGDYSYSELEYEADPASWPGTAVSPDPTSSPASITGLSPGTAYDLRLRHCDEEENCSDWIESTATTLADGLVSAACEWTGGTGTGTGTLNYDGGTNGDDANCGDPVSGDTAYIVVSGSGDLGTVACDDDPDGTPSAFTARLEMARSDAAVAVLSRDFSGTGATFDCTWSNSVDYSVSLIVANEDYDTTSGSNITNAGFGTPTPEALSAQGTNPTTWAACVLDADDITACPSGYTAATALDDSGDASVWACYVESADLTPGAFTSTATDGYSCAIWTTVP